MRVMKSYSIAALVACVAFGALRAKADDGAHEGTQSISKCTVLNKPGSYVLTKESA